LLKILIIRFSSIGDLVLITAAIRCLKEQFPSCEIHLLVKPQYKEVLSANPNIGGIHIYGESFIDTVTLLKVLQFDYVIDLQNNFRSRRLTMKLKKPSYKVRKHNFQKWLMVNFKMKQIQIPHFALRCIQTLKPLGVHDDGKGLDYYYDTPHIPGSMVPDTPYCCIVMGGTHFTKRLPNSKLVDLIEKIGFPVVLLGGPKEMDDAKWVEQKLYKKIYNNVGVLTLNQSALLMDKSTVVVSNDTGLMHIAAALNKPLVSIWGNTTPQMGMTPYYGNESVKQYNAEVKGLSCRPCSKLGRDTCPKKHFKCMIYQDLDAIAKEIEVRSKAIR